MLVAVTEKCRLRTGVMAANLLYASLGPGVVHAGFVLHYSELCTTLI